MNRQCRVPEKADRPGPQPDRQAFGVNIMLMSPFAEEVAQLVAQEIKMRSSVPLKVTPA